MDSMGGLRRSHYADEINSKVLGSEIVVAGSIAKSRDLGGMVFADLRDTTGVLQLAFGDDTPKDVFEKAVSLKAEYVVMAKGKLQKREKANPALFTGEYELQVDDLRVLSRAQTPPFEIRNAANVNDELRLRYRYLDLRQEELHRAISLRGKIAHSIRQFYIQQRFVEIETPMLVKSTPEGARDYLVPSRVQPGHFYALPQSPQLYKQILMLSGFDKYFQLARCFRDEDLRADRQPEFTQIDMEMAFADAQDIQHVNEQLVKFIFKEVLDIDLPTPFLRMEYSQAMERFGSDKPDTRFGLELMNVSDVVANCGFSVFSGAVQNGGSVRLINAKGLASALSRKEIDRLAETAKTYGAKGLAYLRLTGENETSSYEKFLSEEEKQALRQAAGAETGDVLLLVADEDDVVFAALSAVRLEIGKKQGLIPENTFNFLWVTNFPLFEKEAETGRLAAKHHPFTMPHLDDIGLLEKNPAACRAQAYDMVVNGMELGGGSIRINDPELQEKMFAVLGFTPQQSQENFGFLIDAYRYGAPPHGGMAFGLDRLVMLMLNRDSIRDVIAFPKVQNAAELMSGCPDKVQDGQLQELSIQAIQEKQE